MTSSSLAEFFVFLENYSTLPHLDWSLLVSMSASSAILLAPMFKIINAKSSLEKMSFGATVASQLQMARTIISSGLSLASAEYYIYPNLFWFSTAVANSEILSLNAGICFTPLATFLRYDNPAVPLSEEIVAKVTGSWAPRLNSVIALRV